MTFRVAARTALVAGLLFAGCNKDYPNPFGVVVISKPLPKGAALIFTSEAWASRGGAGREVFSIGIDGTNPTRITFCNDGPVACDAVEAAPSPEGTRAAQRRVKVGTQGAGIVYSDLTRGVEADIVPASSGVTGIDWAPTADILVYSGTGFGLLEDLFRVDPNGANAGNLVTSATPVSTSLRRRNPRIDPGTSIVAYESIDPGGKADVFILASQPVRVSPAGTGGALLAGTPYLVGSDANPAFSPDALSVVFRRLTALDSSGLGTWDIMTAKTDGTGFVALAAGPVFRGAPDWSTSGIVFTEIDAAAGTAKLVLVQPDGSGRKVLLTQSSSLALSSPRWLRAVVP